MVLSDAINRETERNKRKQRKRIHYSEPYTIKLSPETIEFMNRCHEVENYLSRIPKLDRVIYETMDILNCLTGNVLRKIRKYVKK